MIDRAAAVSDYRAEMRACAEAINLGAVEIVQPEDLWVDLGGLRFHYLDWGNPHLPHLVLLHGGGLTAHTWDMAALLLRNRYHLVALDQRGHGDSAWTPQEQLGADHDEQMLGDTRGFIDHLGYDHLVLCGHSMGASNAIRYAARHPERLDALVIVDVGPTVMHQGPMGIAQFHHETETKQRFEDFLERAIAFNPERKPEHLRYSLLHSLKPTDKGWTWKQDHRPRPNARPATEEDWARANEDRSRFMRAAFATFRMPMLLTRGQISKSLSQASAAEAVSYVPDSDLVVIPRAGHSVQGDNPKDFARAVDAFLTRRLARED